MSSERVERLAKRRARELLSEGKWSEDAEIRRLFKDRIEAYRNPDGQALLIFADRRGAILYNDRDAFFDEALKLRHAKPAHLLTDRLLYGKKFPEQVPALVVGLEKQLGSEPLALDGSERSLTSVERAVKRIGSQRCLSAEIFTALVAYVGEFIKERTDGHWEMRLATDGQTWEPWIRGYDGQSYAPFGIVYRELTEGVTGSIRGAISGELWGGGENL